MALDLLSAEQLLAIVPPGGPDDYILAMNPQNDIAPLLHTRLGYGHVRGCVPGNAGFTETRSAGLPDRTTFTWRIDHVDLERDFFPYPSAHFKTVLCDGALDALVHDPMYTMDEIHRILRPGCSLVFATGRFTREETRILLENCGFEIVLLKEDGGGHAVARKIGPVRERYPAWLYPSRP